MTGTVKAQTTIDGSIELTITVTPTEAAVLGSDADTLTDYIDTALWALVMLRSGATGDGTAPSAADLAIVVQHMDTRLLPRIEGIRDAAIRAYAELPDASHGRLARAMDVARSTAQDRRAALVAREPSGWEEWAREGGPIGRPNPDSGA